MTTTLLGVDDSKTMRKVLEITFAGEDFHTVLAENADDAMSKLQAERPSVVLVDAGLDGAGGYELCQRLKAAAPGVGVVLLSSKQQPYDRSRGSSVGADDFIDKPFDTQQLIDKVVGLLRKGSTATAARPAASVPAPVAAPPIQVPARPVAAPVEARPRTATLSYGSHSGASLGGSAPVAPVVPTSSGFGARPAATAAAVSVVRSATPAPPPFTPVAAPPVAAHAPPASPSPITVPPTPTHPPAAAVVASHTSNGSDLSHKLANLGLTDDQVAGVLALSREVVERVVWEVVPTLAETLIKEEIRRLTSE